MVGDAEVKLFHLLEDKVNPEVQSLRNDINSLKEIQDLYKNELKDKIL